MTPIFRHLLLACWLAIYWFNFTYTNLLTEFILLCHCFNWENVCLFVLNICVYMLLVLLVLLPTREAAWYIISVVSVCLSEDNFRKLWRRKFVFTNPVYLQVIRVRFVYGHRVTVEVTGPKNVHNRYIRNGCLYDMCIRFRAV